MSRLEPACRACDGAGFIGGIFSDDAGPFFGLICSDCDGRGYEIEPPWSFPNISELELPDDVGC